MNIKHLAAVGVTTLAAAFTPVVYAHAKLEASSPQADAVVTTAPKQVRLQFNEPLEFAFSKVRVMNQKGAAVELSRIAADQSNPNVLIASLPALQVGAYRVQWTAVTRDGHKVKGEFSFRVR
jgi:methionine-rich copper-binding protein CopC